jgi:phage-related protein
VEKPLAWLHGEIKTPPFSREARIEAGFLLGRLQRGELLAMPESRPMPSVGTGCHELRLKDSAVDWRVIYAVRKDAVVVLDVFKKTSRKTPRQVLTNCRTRLRAYERDEGGDR